MQETPQKLCGDTGAITETGRCMWKAQESGKENMIRGEILPHITTLQNVRKENYARYT